MDNNFFVGIDPSYHSTGLIMIDQDANIIEQRNYSIITEENKAKGNLVVSVEAALDNCQAHLKWVLEAVRLNRIYIEAPAYSADGNRVMQMAALHYFICFLFYDAKRDYKRIAPGTLKKYITGNGRAKKDLILLKTYKKWGVEFEIDDLADAYGLARMALEDFTNEQQEGAT